MTTGSLLLSEYERITLMCVLILAAKTMSVTIIECLNSQELLGTLVVRTEPNLSMFCCCSNQVASQFKASS